MKELEENYDTQNCETELDTLMLAASGHRFDMTSIYQSLRRDATFTSSLQRVHSKKEVEK